MAQAARGGRVVSSDFLEPDEEAKLTAELRAEGVGVHAGGGYAGARRRVVTAFPSHIPEATTPLSAIYFEGVHDEDELRRALLGAGIGKEALGDVLKHQAGLTVIVLERAKAPALLVSKVAQAPVAPQEVGLEHLSKGSRRRQTVIVPSLRVDALGAKAFRVSRAYFAKGVAGGKVRIGGEAAGKSSEVTPGDEVYAEGLGRFTALEVVGETRKGNLKVTLEVEA